MDPECSLPHSQKPATYHCSEPVQFSQRPPNQILRFRPHRTRNHKKLNRSQTVLFEYVLILLLIMSRSPEFSFPLCSSTRILYSLICRCHSIFLSHRPWLFTVLCIANITMCVIEQCFSTFVRPRPGKFFFYKTRARSQ